MSHPLLAGAPWARSLPTDRSRRPVSAFLREREQVELEPGGSPGLAGMVAALHGLLARSQDREGAEVAVLLPLDREATAPGRRPAVPLLVRYGLAGDPSLAEVRRRAKAAIADAVDRARADRSPGSTPPAPGGVLLVVRASTAFDTSDEFLLPEEVDALGAVIAGADLVLEVSAGSRWSIACEYDAELFEPDSVSLALDRYVALLRRIGREPDLRLWDVPLDDDSPAPSRIAASPAAAARDVTVPGVLHTIARDRPHAVALVVPGAGPNAQLTYAQLDARADAVAAALRWRGVGPGDVVALLCDRSAAVACAGVGILKTGAACVILDDGDDPGSLARVLQDSGAALAVGPARLLRAVPPAVPCLDLADVAVSTEPEPCRVRLSATDPALIVYSDGPVGELVGVRLAHGCLASTLLALAASCEAGDGSSWLTGSPRASERTLELWTGLLSGGTCLLPPAGAGDPGEDLVADRPAVSHVFLTGDPAERLLAGPPETLDRLRCVLLPGDGERDRRAAELPPAATAYHVYRPGSLPLPVAIEVAERGERRTAWRPLAGLHLDVLDCRGRGAPSDMLGEVCVEGLGSAVDYHGRPDLTAERRLGHRGEDGTERWRTGDVGRRLRDGSVQVLGGAWPALRTRWSGGELAEIEDVLRTNPGVVDVVAVEQRGPDLQSRKVAYVVPAPGRLPGDLGDWLRARRPVGTVPPRFVLLAALPVRDTGEVDHRLLPLVDPAPASPEPGGPETDTERALAAIWAEVLESERIGRHDDFFSLGGHSLLAMRVESRVQAVFGVDLPRRLLFERPTIAGIAGVIEDLVAEQVSRLSDEEVMAALEGPDP